MALNIPLTTMALTCFNRDEIEDMLQWRVLQDGQFLDVAHGTYTHLYEQERRMHWFHYLEDEEGNEKTDASWRLDLHYEAGAEAVRNARLEDSLNWSLQVSDQDNRFHPPVPVVLKHNDQDVHLVVELVNKNMMPETISSQDTFELSINFIPLNFELFPSLDDMIGSMQHEIENVPEIPNIFPMGLLLDQMMASEEGLDEDMQTYIQNIVAAERINPVLLTHIAAPIVKVEEIPLGNSASVYDVTLQTEAGEFHMPISNIYPEAQDLEAGLYIYVTGFFSAMYMSDFKQAPPKENVIPFNVLN